MKNDRDVSKTFMFMSCKSLPPPSLSNNARARVGPSPPRARVGELGPHVVKAGVEVEHVLDIPVGPIALRLGGLDVVEHDTEDRYERPGPGAVQLHYLLMRHTSDHAGNPGSGRRQGHQRR